LRVNQWQVDINVKIVSKNRPDLQHALTGKLHYVQ